MATRNQNAGSAGAPDVNDDPPRRKAVRATIILTALGALLAVGLFIATLSALSTRQASPLDPNRDPGPFASASASASASGEPSPGAPPAADPSSPGSPAPTAVADPPMERAVEIDAPAQIVSDLTAEISKVEAVDGIARGPGEVAGPSLRVTVTVTNSTSEGASLATTVVSAYYGRDRAPAAELREPGGAPLPDSVAAGDTATGVYIFVVPEAERGNVTIMVDYSVTVGPLVFQGDVAELMRR